LADHLKAEQGYVKGEVPVGCVFVRIDESLLEKSEKCEIIAFAHNLTNASKNAQFFFSIIIMCA